MVFIGFYENPRLFLLLQTSRNHPEDDCLINMKCLLTETGTISIFFQKADFTSLQVQSEHSVAFHCLTSLNLAISKLNTGKVEEIIMNDSE